VADLTRVETWARFWRKVSFGPGCWEWQGWRDQDGYGQFDKMRTHRVAWLAVHQDAPPVVRHTCDNPPCVRPSHLLGGTTQDNVDDKMQRGRWRGTHAVVPEVPCPVCGTPFKPVGKGVKQGRQKTCSRACGVRLRQKPTVPGTAC
jgi:hypothetical protein